MRRALVLFSCLFLALVASTACTGDDSSATSTTGGGGEGGNTCPTDTCGQCPAGLSCCNGQCVDILNGDLNNCGVCCKACPNQYTACTNGECVQ
jgi:hypothetical protein